MACEHYWSSIYPNRIDTCQTPVLEISANSSIIRVPILPENHTAICNMVQFTYLSASSFSFLCSTAWGRKGLLISHIKTLNTPYPRLVPVFHTTTKSENSVQAIVTIWAEVFQSDSVSKGLHVVQNLADTPEFTLIPNDYSGKQGCYYRFWNTTVTCRTLSVT